MAKNKISRRHFIGALATSGVVAGLAGCAIVPVHRAYLQDGHLILKLDEMEELLSEKNAFILQADGLPEPLLVVRTATGGLNVLGATCTHQMCQVRPGRGFLNCPCHGSTFDLDGQVVRGPATKPLTSYRFTTNASSMEIWLQ
jgi:Rieske Fe-S protein